ncbi:hypothetical protein [Donghicola sp. XS_ASV15]|uniref:hypothetical protein n=1 Tax=Donghicola sp. XS_ASV15 TaxID=3241295 RepID=UPI003514CFBF
MRLGPGLLYEGRTLQGARPKLADFCSATMAEFYSAVDTMAGGTTSIDVGCMQVNYRWHGEGFSSLEDMFDPAANTAYAAEFLTRLKERNELPPEIRTLT